ncbi:unnamed protein product [Coregonus sp. 'balchen']|nr:unnamed protein product [Coregonus sp. 'balchen']
MHVLLLKEPREGGSGPDPYIKALASHGHKATLIPVLSFTFVSLNTLSDKLFQPEQHGGMVFTSPRAVEAVRMCLEDDERREEWNRDMKDKWNAKSIYVVGKATAAAGVPLETLMVYQTAQHPDLEKNLKNHFTEQFAAIGPTTADAMTAEGLSVSCSADRPTAEHLATGIAKALQ